MKNKNIWLRFPKKMIVYISRLQKCFLNFISTPKIGPKDKKITPKGPIGAKEAQNVTESKTKR